MKRALKFILFALEKQEGERVHDALRCSLTELSIVSKAKKG